MRVRNRGVTGMLGRLAVGAGLVAGLAGAAIGRGDICQVYRAGVPDFDQKRDDMPNDGKMYCVPTSWVNWLAFLQNNGYDGLMWPTYGTQNWQSQTHYNTVTSRIEVLADLFDIDPYDGGSPDMGELADYIWDHTSPNPYIISMGWSVHPGTDMIGPKPQLAATQLLMGGMVCLGISWFKAEGGHWERHGGHSVTMFGASNLCDGLPILKWKDPGSSDSYSLQSTFSSSNSTMFPLFDVFSWADDSSNHYALIWQFQAYTGPTKGFLTSVRTMMLNFGLGIDTSTSSITMLRPLTFAREALPSLVDFKIPDANLVVDFQLEMDLTSALVVKGGLDPAVSRLALGDGSVKPLFKPGKAGPMATGRFGEIFYCDGSVLKAINPETGKEDGAVGLTNPFTHMVYDDGRDELVGIDPLKRRIVQFNRHLQETYDKSLPDGVDPQPASSVGIHPVTRELWVLPGDDRIIEISRPREGNPIAKVKKLPGIKKCGSLQFLPDGGITVVSDGEVREFRPDKDGNFKVSDLSGFNGRKAKGLFRVGQSRDNIPEAWRHVAEPDVQPPAEGPEELVDCPSDYDGSDFVDLDDFIAFVADFEEGVLRADFDYSGFVDLEDFIGFVGAFENGC
ncbi:MAG: hypothetical protein IT435_07060 [Phycisphaerales bacterium]|nr:hypothetical protein [Phycisphaerales bacterium]